MRWSDIRAAHPDHWLVIEAVEAHSENNHRIFDEVAVIEVCQDGHTAMKRYGELHHQYPSREIGFVHTSRPEIAFEERLWLGIRGLRESDVSA